jgi:hypothetical protein
MDELEQCAHGRLLERCSESLLCLHREGGEAAQVGASVGGRGDDNCPVSSEGEKIQCAVGDALDPEMHGQLADAELLGHLRRWLPPLHTSDAIEYQVRAAHFPGQGFARQDALPTPATRATGERNGQNREAGGSSELTLYPSSRRARSRAPDSAARASTLSQKPIGLVRICQERSVVLKRNCEYEGQLAYSRGGSGA